ncbi:uncharacterized protein LOC122722383 [Manihot esculenta]|uniref:uncharacterized protein LOC122722383 n=1 Tax=Manihot esculenta TaxID=3983 RepID=UPI001CC4359D|nr:uncharacterized protein LOC122722383 [Manihot esculenta]
MLPSSHSCFYLQASKMKIDQVKPPKILTLPRGSLNVASDALLVGRSAGWVTQQVVEVISSRSSGRSPPPALAQAPESSFQGAGSSRPSGIDRSVLTALAVQALRSPRTSKPSEDFGLTGAKPAPPSSDASGGRLEASTAEMGVLASRTEIASVGSVHGVLSKVSPATEDRELSFVDDGGVVEKVRGKRPIPTEVLVLVRVSKKSWAFRRPAPAFLPFGEKEKLPVVPLMSAPNSNSRNNMISEIYCGIQDAVHTRNTKQLMAGSCQDFDIGRLCYEKQRFAVLSRASVAAFKHVFRDIQSLAYKYASEDNALVTMFKSGSMGNLLKLVQHSMCVDLQHSLVPLPFRMPRQFSRGMFCSFSNQSTMLIFLGL